MTALFIDTEWTDRESREVIEVAWLRFPDVFDLAGPSDEIPELDLCTAATFTQRYRPIKPISYGAMAAHHILPHELEDCPPTGTFTLPTGIEYLVGHSVDQDWKAIGSPSVKRICTDAMARWVWPDADAYSQSALIYMLCGPNETTREMVRNAHSAYRDVVMNVQLLFHILKAKPEIRTWSGLYAYSEECRIPRVCPFKRYEGVPLTELPDDYIDWCLAQHWLDPYLRKGLYAELDRRSACAEGHFAEVDDEDDDDDFF